MEIFRKIIGFFKKRYWILLLIVVFISYGHILMMFPWQDDHALMFKLAHMEDSAGFLGKGIFGEGPYKYTASFYYPLYFLFGYNIPLFFLQSLAFYFFATLAVYKVFSAVIGKSRGKLAGFLFAAGYVATDGFIRLFNSVATSLSVIFISFFTLCYWNFYKKKKVIWYFFAATLYFLAVEFIRYRTHYLIAVVVAFEFIFLFSKKSILKSVAASIVRLLPFVFIFYRYFVSESDSRSGRVSELIISLFKGEFYKLYSFLASIANLVVPDWLTNKLPAFSIKVFSSPQLNLGPREQSVVLLGILTLISAIWFLAKLKNDRKLYLFFLFWAVVNIATYAAYEPTHAHETTNRFLAHSFFALTAILAIVAWRTRWLYFAVIFWGVGNLVGSFYLQKAIVTERSKPAANFYRQLKDFVPRFQKGDVLYFDVADSTRQNFTDSFSVAQMPEETALAWQYGIDRYDIRTMSDYDVFLDLIKNGSFTDTDNQPLQIKNIFTFFYDKKALVSTGDKFTELKKGFSEVEDISPRQFDEQYDFTKEISCVLRPTITFTLSAVPKKEGSSLSVNQGGIPILEADNYERQKENFYNSVKIISSSSWKERINGNLIDQNPNTVWQADRVLWDKEKTFYGFDLGEARTLARFVWVNGFANNSPTAYSIEVSDDRKSWREVARVENSERIEPTNFNEVVFGPVRAKFIRMVIDETLNMDSPGISEAWVVERGLENHSVSELEASVHSSDFARFRGRSHVSALWLSNASDKWQSDYTAGFDLITDGKGRKHSAILPCRGTSLKSIKLDQFEFPIDLTLYGIKVDYPPIL